MDASNQAFVMERCRFAKGPDRAVSPRELELQDQAHGEGLVSYINNAT